MEFKLEESINHRIATLAILLKRKVFRIIAKNNLEISPEQWVVLYYLWQENGLSIGEIAKRSKKDFANTTRIIDKLEKLGYIKKCKNEVDNRSFKIFVLPKADDIKEDIHKCWKEATELALEGISYSEQKQFLIVLDKIENNII